MVETNVYLKKQWFIKSKAGKVEDNYQFDIKKLLGSGTYGNVIKAVHANTKELRAIKVIQKSKVRNKDRFQLEIDIMRQLDHPNVIKLYETFEDARNLYLVMELCEGGELFDRIIAKGHFNEKEARNLFTQIMLALNYCHANKICHRDLKPENFLLLTKADDSPIKVIDFGLSTYITDKGAMSGSKVAMTTKAGTPYYISPEVLAGEYDEKCDIWSAGVILYILLSGVPPFYGDTDPQILDSVKKGLFTFDIPEFKGVSESAKDLIKKMICKPAVRLTAQQSLDHPWMKADLEKATLNLNWGSLKNFQNYNKLKKATLTFIASQLSENEIQELGKLFKSIDKNGDGVLTVEEIKNALVNQKDQNIKDIQSVLDSIDTDGSGTINYTEFLAATMEKAIYLKEEKLFNAFRMFDADGSGKISAEELKATLGSDEKFKNLDKSYWENMIKEADKNNDGEIDYNEFLEMMGKTKI
jgi:calcium-dependent protein kinase